MNDEAQSQTQTDESHLGVRDRWLSAVAYLGPGCLIPLFDDHRSRYVTWHTRQGLTLFMVEVALVLFFAILHVTIGRIPILGALIVILVDLVGFVAALVLSLIGFVKALAGERSRMPVLDEYAERVPIEETQAG